MFIKVRKPNSKDKIQKKENILSDNSVEKIKLFTKKKDRVVRKNDIIK